MTDTVIVDSIRTPLGKRNGWLREQHPVNLGSHVIGALLDRTGLDKAKVDHVIFGCVSQVAEQTLNIARNVVLDAELPVEVPATAVDFQCGSSQQALHLAAAMVSSGQADVVIAGGVESMTRVPMGSSLGKGGASPFTDNIMEAYNMIPQGIASDEIAARWGISRQAMDELSMKSHKRAGKATEEGIMRREIAPLQGVDEDGNLFTVDRDQGIRPSTTLEKMAQLDTVFTPNGVTTAGNSSQISDGAAAALVMTDELAAQLALPVRARIIEMTTVGRRSASHADGTDRSHKKGAGASRHVHERDRSLRGQRSICLCAAHLGTGYRRGFRPRQYPRRRHRLGASTGRLRRAIADHLD